MKKVFIAMLFILLAVPAFAIDPYAPTGRNVDVVYSPEDDSVTLISAATATGDKTAVDLGFHAKVMGCTITLGGTAPTSVTVSLKRSTDAGSNYATMLTHTYTVATTTTQAFDVQYVGRYWKASFDSKVGGSTDTAVTLKCDVKE